MTKRGIHTRPNDGASTDWLTPPWLITALGEFDLDPCAYPGQRPKTAKRMIAPPRDGLTAAWSGRVWLNPPYGSQTGRWLEKLAAHGRGIALVPARTEVEKWFWPYIWNAADGILFLRGRLYFTHPRRPKTGNAGHGSVLVAYGTEEADLLASLVHDVPADETIGRYFTLRPCAGGEAREGES